ncbi:MAG TPA: hypothetical protein PKL13_01150 [bacterium]|nr:hypothetical protein [bacterium]
MNFDSSDRGVLTLLAACGIKHKSIKKLSSLCDLVFEFHYKHGIITQVIENVFLTMAKDLDNNEYPQLEISLNMKQSPSFICLACMIKGTLCVPKNPEWKLISNNGRNSKFYSGIFKIFYSKSQKREIRKKQ